MEFIQSYLSRYYILKRPLKNHFNFIGIFPINDDENLRYAEDLIEELFTIFNIDENNIKIVVNLWANNTSLLEYWSHEKPFFPNITNVVSSLISLDLVSVVPMSKPSDLLYLDFSYTGDTPNKTVEVILE